MLAFFRYKKRVVDQPAVRAEQAAAAEAMPPSADERGPNDRLISWWFYYRGETFFTKQDIWVMKNPDRLLQQR